MDGIEFQETLNHLGQDGWELVSVFDTDYGHGKTDQVLAVCKRPLG